MLLLWFSVVKTFRKEHWYHLRMLELRQLPFGSLLDDKYCPSQSLMTTTGFLWVHPCTLTIYLSNLEGKPGAHLIEEALLLQMGYIYTKSLPSPLPMPLYDFLAITLMSKMFTDFCIIVKNGKRLKGYQGEIVYINYGKLIAKIICGH